MLRKKPHQRQLGALFQVYFGRFESAEIAEPSGGLPGLARRFRSAGRSPVVAHPRGERG
jgi:hypothetical protein